MEIEKKIVEEATAKAYAMIKEAKEQRARVLREEEQRLKEWVRREKESFKKSLEERKKEEMASMRLEAKRIINNAYQRKFEEALNVFAEEFKRFKKTKQYSSWLSKLLKRALAELEESEKEVIVHVSKGDKKHIKTKAKVVGDLSDIGGLIVEKKDGKVRVNYSFSQILESTREQLRERFMKEFAKK